MAFTLRPSDILKTTIIDYLIERYEGIVIGDEVMYGSSRKVVDLLALYHNETYAIEIKSSSDNLSRLGEQLVEYSKIFDHTLLFVDSSYYNAVKNLNCSVFQIEKEKVMEGTSKKTVNRTIKFEQLATIPAYYLRKDLAVNSQLDADALRKKAMSLKKDIVHQILYDFLMARLAAPYRLFLTERQDKTTIDDLSLLSKRLHIN